MQAMRRFAVGAGVAGSLLVVGALALGVVSIFWRAWELCTYVPMPAGVAPDESTVVDSFPTLVPLGYGCTWGDGAETVSMSFANWPLTGCAIAGFALILLAGFVLSGGRVQSLDVSARTADK